jgi:putative addiction module killer protein
VEIVVRRYRTLDGAEPFTQWLDGLTDPKAKALVLVRIERLALGAFGDVRPLREGVLELRIDYGPGYRVYFAREGAVAVLLLCGSDKRRQDKEIRRAIDLWREYRSRRSRGPGASR